MYGWRCYNATDAATAATATRTHAHVHLHARTHADLTEGNTTRGADPRRDLASDDESDENDDEEEEEEEEEEEVVVVPKKRKEQGSKNAGEVKGVLKKKKVGNISKVRGVGVGGGMGVF